MAELTINPQNLSENELSAIAYSMSWIGADFVQEFQEELLTPLDHRERIRAALAEIYPQFEHLGLKKAVSDWFDLLESMGENPSRVCSWLFSMLEEDGKQHKRDKWETLFVMPSEDKCFADYNDQRRQVDWIFEGYTNAVFSKFQRFDGRLQSTERTLKVGSGLSYVDRQIQGWPDGSWTTFGTHNFSWKYLVRLQRDWYQSIQARLTQSDLYIIDGFYKRKYEPGGKSVSAAASHMPINEAFARYRGLNFWDYCSAAQ